MTNEEAIEIFDDNWTVIDTHGHYTDEEVEQARQMAIKALQELEKKRKRKNILIKYDRIVKNAKPFKTYGDIIIVDRKQ